MNFWVGWMLRGLVMERPKPVEPGPVGPQPPRRTEPLSLMQLAFCPFTFAAKLMAWVALLTVLLAVGGMWTWGLIQVGLWVMDRVETFARPEWGVGQRALYVVAPGLIAMALYWAVSVFIAGGIGRGWRHALQGRATRRQVRALLRQAREEAGGDDP